MELLRRLLSRVMDLTRFFVSSSRDWRRRLTIRGRPTLRPSDFRPVDRLFRGYSFADLDESGNIDVESFERRDLSCNWDRFSIPSDIHHRPSGRETDGCYSLSVETARFKNLATPCHDPIQGPIYENYAHVEIRWLSDGEDIDYTPPHGRNPSKSKMAKALRLEWRTNAVRNLTFEIQANA
jgi:hypothetical protein